MLSDLRELAALWHPAEERPLRRLFAWAREERIIPVNPALELRTGWGGSVRRRVIIPSIPQVFRLAQALDLFKAGLGDVAMVLAFTGLRWEEAVAVPIGNVSLDGQCMRIDRTASESGGRRDVREDLKTRAAERTVMIPDIAMPALRRLADRGTPGRERSDGRLYSRLINGDRGGYLGYAMWRRYLKLAQGYTAAHPDGIVSYTAHELRHVCASLLIASGASDVQVAHQMGHSRIETTKNIYGNPRKLHQPGEKPQVSWSALVPDRFRRPGGAGLLTCAGLLALPLDA